MSGAPWRGLPLACPRCEGRLETAPGGATCPGCGAAYPEEGGVLRLVTRTRGAPGYDPHYFASLAHVEERHFWFVARREIVLDALRASVPDLDERPLFDVGCGTGGLLVFLRSRGVRLAGACDAYPEGLAIARRRLDAPLVLVDDGAPPPLAPGHRLLALFDVLEHVDDDVGALRRLWAALEPGGTIVITVPAHPALFDETDLVACHRRRYTRAGLESVLLAAGFTPRRLTHFMLALAPVAAVARPVRRWLRVGRSGMERLEGELRVRPGLNEVVLAWLRLERRWLRARRLPIGTSLLAVAERPRW